MIHFAYLPLALVLTEHPSVPRFTSRLAGGLSRIARKSGGLVYQHRPLISDRDAWCRAYLHPPRSITVEAVSLPDARYSQYSIPCRCNYLTDFTIANLVNSIHPGSIAGCTGLRNNPFSQHPLFRSVNILFSVQPIPTHNGKSSNAEARSLLQSSR